MRGQFVISVWQDLEARRTFAWSIVRQTITVLASLLLSVIVLSWFGLRHALRPLTNLEASIGRRSGDELTPIQRPVPSEVQGIVETFNALLDRISRRISSKDAFISNAAHQLRTPIAGVLSLAQTLEAENKTKERSPRVTALVQASQHLSRVTNQLLSFERIQDGGTLPLTAETYNLTELTTEVIERSAPDLLRDGVSVQFEPGPAMQIKCIPVLIQEMLQNLIDNSVKHANVAELQIEISTCIEDSKAVVRVRDNGIGLSPKDSAAAFARFSQVRVGVGSGLGLSIARLICQNHGGGLVIEEATRGASLAAFFPFEAAVAA